MKIRKMLDSAWAISLLAVLGLVVSTSVIAGLLYFTLPLIGIEIPFILSAFVRGHHFPPQILWLFWPCLKNVAFRRLAMIFEGES